MGKNREKWGEMNPVSEYDEWFIIPYISFIAANVYKIHILNQSK